MRGVIPPTNLFRFKADMTQGNMSSNHRPSPLAKQLASFQPCERILHSSCLCLVHALKHVYTRDIVLCNLAKRKALACMEST